ncbi:MAG TPA: hypothetical protein VK053_07165 [Jiangellaceae bacterium]|nr:hypothetical protein [Jiangellaceae bacterium]
MARYLFGESALDLVVAPPSSTPPMAAADGASIPGVVVAQANRPVLVSLTEGGTPVTDLQTPSGTPITEVVADSDGRYRFRGPDDVSVLWLSGDDGQTWFQVVSAQLIAEAAAYRPPLVLIESGESVPPAGTMPGALVYRKQA